MEKVQMKRFLWMEKVQMKKFLWMEKVHMERFLRIEKVQMKRFLLMKMIQMKRFLWMKKVQNMQKILGFFQYYVYLHILALSLEDNPTFYGTLCMLRGKSFV